MRWWLCHAQHLIITYLLCAITYIVYNFVKYLCREKKKCHLKNLYAVKNINKCKQCANFFFPGKSHWAMREHRMDPFVSMKLLFLYPSISFFFVLFVVWLFVLCDALSCIGFLSFLSELSLLSHWDPIINNPSHFNACTFTVTTILLILRCHKIGHNVGTPCWIVSHFVALAKCTIPTAHVIFIPIYIYFYVFCMYTISRKFIESNFVCGNIAYKCDTVAS